MAWPGGGLSSQDLTGVINHHSLGDFVAFAKDLLVDLRRGFLLHNLALLLAIPGIVLLAARRVPELPEIVWAGVWSASTWLTYALFSTNFAGQCCSIRWLLPLLAPGYLILAVFLRYYPRVVWALLLVSAWCFVFLTVPCWFRGPWETAHGPLVWLTVAGVVLSGFVHMARVGIRRHSALAILTGRPEDRRRAA
jgi:hypothetical protein